ncbi:DUF1349 domain-containing protein [Arthrobacter sp. M2012083]|uniref:DUF1349 domain-containing protein n=1 Tax=Arthrobacter sp. M2012083 TaxID=1197706 RepID=UPI0002F147C4|nr:DUF1349 domain-containing protein [Arthrobacter sp. M2012083]
MQHFLKIAEWTTVPVTNHFDGRLLNIEAAKGSDFWQETHYGFKRDSGHALLAPIDLQGSLEVTFQTTFGTLYDQAGLMIRNDEAEWIKAGIEINDGAPHAAAVVTRGQSDWSLSPTPDWADQEVTIRASWRDGAITIRAKKDQSPWSMLRVAPMTIGPTTKAGLYVCSPERAGLRVSFTRAKFGPPDAELHSEP